MKHSMKNVPSSAKRPESTNWQESAKSRNWWIQLFAAVALILLEVYNGKKGKDLSLIHILTNYMAFFEQAITVLQTLVIALGAGLGIWGVINLLEGYGNDNPGAKSQGMKQLMAGAGVAVVGMVLVPLLSGLFSV